nr:ester cyclase [Cellulosimicrobium arenosum]
MVRDFFDVVRSGREPGRAGEFMAPLVRAHQVTSHAPTTVERTPAEYAEHVGAMVTAYGHFSLTVDELLADDDRVYVRWTQRGRHLGDVDGIAPTGREVVEVASCVYRVAADRVVEYWIQVDRAGLAAQLARGPAAR